MLSPPTTLFGMTGAGCEALWDAYQPRDAFYLHDPSGIHGIGHAARVLVWANLLAHHLRAHDVSIDLEVVRWAATLHDVRRANDGRDPAHGERCRTWLHDSSLPRRGAPPPSSPTSPATQCPTVSDEQRQVIAYCCEWHVPPDADAPAMTPELTCLKDADALDRVRLGSVNGDLLRTAYAKALVGQAQFLCDYSETQAGFREDQWHAVRQAALRMGLWPPSEGSASIGKRLRFLAS